MAQQAQSLPRPPIAHILMGIAGWVLYVFKPYTAVFVLAIILSALAVPRFVRGSWQKADAEITLKLHRPTLPSRRVAGKLLATERLLWETHEHPMRLIWWWLSGVVALAVVIIVSVYTVWQVAAIGAALDVTVLGVRYFLLRHNRLCLTDQRLVSVRGLFELHVGTMPLKKLTDESFEAPWHSTILAWLRIIRMEYGTIRVESAGQDQALSKIKFMPDITQLNRIIMTEALRS